MGPSLLFTSWEHLPWRAGLGEAWCLRKTARFPGTVLILDPAQEMQRQNSNEVCLVDDPRKPYG